MSTARRDLIFGAVVLALFACGIIDSLTNVIRNQQYLPPTQMSSTAANMIGWIATLWAVGSVITAAYLVSRTNNPLREWSQRFIIRAAIPAYFAFALVPIALGAFLITVGLTTWGWWLSCLSVPSILLLLALDLRGRSNA
jgi:hypothetical protein